MYFHRNFLAAVQPILNGDGSLLRYQAAQAPDFRLANSGPADSTVRMSVDGNSLSFSQNGKWMVFSAPGGSMVRLNLETFEVFKFGLPISYGIGLDPAIRTAVSNDGRFVAMNAPYGNPGFSVIDLEACVPPEPGMVFGDLLVTGHQCQSRSLEGQLRALLPDYRGATPWEFLSSQMLVFYSSYRKPDGSRQYVRMLATAGDGAAPQLDYLALGDSYSSGEGAHNYRAGTDEPENKCHQSLDSYPHLISRLLDFRAFASVACSGARMGDIARDSQYVGDRDEALASFLPGLRPQLDFVRLYRPDKVTVGIVGNDIGFSEIAKACALPGTCYATFDSRRWLVASMRAKFWDLAELLSAIRWTGASEGRDVYVVGYPQIVLPSGGSCGPNVRLNTAEREFATLLVADLNTMIRAAALRAGVFYVDVEHALDGSRLCETSSPAVNGLTAGGDIPVPLLGSVLGRESFHPNRLGQELLREAVIEGTSHLATSMPSPDGTVLPPADTEFRLLGSDGSGGGAASLYVSLGPGTAFVQSPYPVEIQGSTFALQPGASYTVNIQSDPVVLGSATADSTGALSGTFVIPAAVSPGFHEVHITGPGSGGNPIDVFQFVLIGASPTDWDGNGVADALQACVFVEPSGVDADRDGIDDGCDGLIDNEPADAIPPVTVADVSPDPNASGWNRSDVFVSLVASDDTSGVKNLVYETSGALALSQTTSPGDRASIAVSAEGQTTIAFFAVDEAGNVEPPKTLVIRLDKTPPTVAVSRSPEANAHGWNNSDATVTFVCSDPLSGIASCPQPTTVASEGRDQSVVGSASDLAGNEAQASVGGINIDKTAPVVAATRTPGPNLYGWNNTDVAARFEATDTLSGIDGEPTFGHVFREEGASQSVTRTFSDLAGNETTGSVREVSIDKTAPSIEGSRLPAPNAHGWNNVDVTASFACADVLSGIASCTEPVTLTSEGADQSVGGWAEDQAGNVAEATVAGISIDKTPPEISGFRTPAPNVHGWNNTDVTVFFACADALAGIDTCGPTPQVVSAGGFGQARTATAVDRADNRASATVGVINVDKTPPQLSCAATPNSLWPPNHRMVSIALAVGLGDALSGPLGFWLASATSNEPDAGPGIFSNDIQGFDVGTADTAGQLRAERLVSGNGRVYTLAYTGSDRAFNVASCAATVVVPHDMNANARRGGR